MLDLEKINVMIIQLDSKMSDVEITSIQSDFIFDEVSKTRTMKEIDIEFVNDLSYKYLIM